MTENPDFLPPDIVEAEENPETALMMNWLEHLTELRSRLLKTIVFFLVSFCAVYPFVQHMLDFLFLPLQNAMTSVGGTHRVIFTSLAEGFLTHVTLAVFSAVFFTFPYFLYQVWLFIKPALHPLEKRVTMFVMGSAPFLFVIGILFSFFAVMPMAFRFLLSFQQLSETTLPVMLEARLSEYLYFIVHMLLAFGFGFQFPVVLYLAVTLGLCSIKSLKTFRRYMIVIVFIFSAIVTPPDIVSQIALALPLLGLYEITLLLLNKKSS